MNASQIRKARSAEIARRDNTKNPAIKAAAIRNIQSLNIQLARRIRTFGEN